MTVQLLKLRYLQIRRDLGYWFIPILLSVFFVSKEISEQSQLYALSLGAVCILFLYVYHTNRKDLSFIKHYLAHPLRDVCINYNLLTLSVSLALALSGWIMIALCLHLFVSLLVFTKINFSGPAFLFIGKHLPSSEFEWISGIRKNFIPLLILFLLALLLSPVKFFGVVALFLMNSIFLSFYSEFEPLPMLNPNNLSAEHFLKQKISFFIKVLLVLNVPLLLVNSVFHPDIIWFNLCFLIGFSMLASFSVYIKYANYQPKHDLKFHIDYLFFYAAALIPFLLPLSFFLNISHKKKAIQNLLNYTDDQG